LKQNRWHVYEWLKQTYMFSGKIPTIYQTRRHFGKSITEEELSEGIIEFVLMIKKPIRNWRGKGYTKVRRRFA